MKRIAKWFIGLVGFGLGFWIFYSLFASKFFEELVHAKVSLYPLITMSFFGGMILCLIGLILSDKIIDGALFIYNALESRIQKYSSRELLIGLIGLIIGLIIANLLRGALTGIPIVGKYLPIPAYILLGYLGMNIALKRQNDMLGGGPDLFKKVKELDEKLETLSKKEGKGKEKEYQEERFKTIPKVLDTSVIIDGRILEICKANFMEGALVVPYFVLEELRHIADSSDDLKRIRGRHGLDILKKMQDDPNINVVIYEDKIDSEVEVDDKLIKLTQILNGKIVTNDYNLNKVATLKGVSVLNINELSNALKSFVLPGETMTVTIVKHGKEAGQGIAYLDDGTMVVTENSKKLIGQTVEVMVTSVLQTAAGRMIFAKPISSQ